MIDRTPGGDRRESGRSLPGHRQDIGRKFGHLKIKSASGRTVSRRRSSGYHWVSLRFCSRSRKSAGDRRISKNRNPAKIAQKSAVIFGIKLYCAVSFNTWDSKHRSPLGYITEKHLASTQIQYTRKPGFWSYFFSEFILGIE